MNAEPTVPAGTSLLAGTASANATTPAWANRDHAARPAPVLGPKASQRQTRRQQRQAQVSASDASHQAHKAHKTPQVREMSGTAQLTTADAAVSFLLKASGNALYVERIQRRPLGTHLVQCMVFAGAEDFEHWCEAEPLRFDDPGLHERLCRQGREFFSGHH